MGVRIWMQLGKSDMDVLYTFSGNENQLGAVNGRAMTMIMCECVRAWERVCARMCGVGEGLSIAVASLISFRLHSRFPLKPMKKPNHLAVQNITILKWNKIVL